MAIFDFGNISGINMLTPGALSSRILTQFGGYDYRHGDFNGPLGRLQILSTSNAGAFIFAYGAWAFNPDGMPTDNSTVYRIEVWSSSGYRLVLDNIGVSFSQLRSALQGKNLAPLYAEHRLEVLGNQWADTLAGGARDDELYGYGRNDVLHGNGGNDSLDGMTGDDTMIGGAGNDDYVVNRVQDVIIEASGGGVDLAMTSIGGYTLPDFVEDLSVLTLAGAVGGTGNSLANYMAGNASRNSLRGVAGNDTLVGLDGNDVLEGGADNDSLVGGDGNDRLVGGDGVDRFFGGSGDDTLYGGAGAERLRGDTGHDRLDGGPGADELLGSYGNDTLIWDDADTIVNGGPGASDTLRLLAGDLDLTGVPDSLITNIERISMLGGTNTLTLGEADVLAISSSTNALGVLGEAVDTVDITSPFVADKQRDGYTRYAVGAGFLWIDSDITVT